MTAMNVVVAINALIRISSVRSTCCVKAREKSADTAEPCAPPLSHPGPGIIFIWRHCASIEGPAEAGHRDRHRQQHQCNECNRVILQIREASALQHDGADNANVMGQRQPLAEI